MAGTGHFRIETEARTSEKEPRKGKWMLKDSYQNSISFIKIRCKTVQILLPITVEQGSQ